MIHLSALPQTGKRKKKISVLILNVTPTLKYIAPTVNTDVYSLFNSSKKNTYLKNYKQSLFQSGAISILSATVDV